MKRLALAVLALSLLTGAAAAQTGHASWYGTETCRSKKACRTANGEHFNGSGMTAAHRSLPFGTKVRVEDLTTKRSIIVRINDRGPFVGGRIIDLSKAAAGKLGILSRGAAKVRISPVK